jgi:hypothetical protein
MPTVTKSTITTMTSLPESIAMSSKGTSRAILLEQQSEKEKEKEEKGRRPPTWMESKNARKICGHILSLRQYKKQTSRNNSYESASIDLQKPSERLNLPISQGYRSKYNGLPRLTC